MASDELIELRDFYARQVLTEKRNERLRQKRVLVQTFWLVSEDEREPLRM